LYKRQPALTSMLSSTGTGAAKLTSHHVSPDLPIMIWDLRTLLVFPPLLLHLEGDNEHRSRRYVRSLVQLSSGVSSPIPHHPSPNTHSVTRVMTPEELALLQQIGKSLRQSFAAIIVKTFLYALYVVCFVKAVRILRRKNVGWMMGVNMSITILLFLMASTLISLDISNFVTEINTTFVDNSGTVLDESYGEANSATFKRVLGIDAVYGYMTVLGDAIIIWRVHAFWGEGRQRWVLYILYAMLLGSIVTACLLNYCVAALGTQLFLGGFQHPLFCRNIQITSYAMPAATTFVATTLIALTFWSALEMH
ncbi:hypothetical protein H0H92_002446, partial [Tricholoma furcatifolium]